jgi:ABC-2 type transport system ATP-binding protein
MRGGVAAAHLDETLARVGLAERARDKVRNYSLGMKQRLAVAAAIMHRPEMVILDEPTNGLDPAGIREFRALVRELAAGGMTVFVSSHILSELSRCTRGILSRRLISEGPSPDARSLLHYRADDDRHARLDVRAVLGAGGSRDGASWLSAT